MKPKSKGGNPSFIYSCLLYKQYLGRLGHLGSQGNKRKYIRVVYFGEGFLSYFQGKKNIYQSIYFWQFFLHIFKGKTNKKLDFEYNIAFALKSWLK